MGQNIEDLQDNKKSLTCRKLQFQKKKRDIIGEIFEKID